jgi:hypothetical protein
MWAGERSLILTQQSWNGSGQITMVRSYRGEKRM